jgi:hypothetical protein
VQNVTISLPSVVINFCTSQKGDVARGIITEYSEVLNQSELAVAALANYLCKEAAKMDEEHQGIALAIRISCDIRPANIHISNAAKTLIQEEKLPLWLRKASCHLYSMHLDSVPSYSILDSINDISTDEIRTSYVNYLLMSTVHNKHRTDVLSTCLNSINFGPLRERSLILGSFIVATDWLDLGDMDNLTNTENTRCLFEILCFHKTRSGITNINDLECKYCHNTDALYLLEYYKSALAI